MQSKTTSTERWSTSVTSSLVIDDILISITIRTDLIARQRSKNSSKLDQSLAEIAILSYHQTLVGFSLKRIFT